MAEFTRELYQLLRVKLAATTAYHPQGDGQTERINQELEQFLCLFINQRQDDWDDLLPFMEFQYNNHTHSATQNVPFFLDTGCQGTSMWYSTSVLLSRSNLITCPHLPSHPGLSLCDPILVPLCSKMFYWIVCNINSRHCHR